MLGLNAKTGATCRDEQHVRQSIGDILTTPLNSRIMRLGYGSRLPDLIDAPLNRLTRARLYAAAAQAISRFEPRMTLQQVTLTAANVGEIVLTVRGTLPDGRALSFDIGMPR